MHYLAAAAAGAEWWQVVGAIGTPALAVCSYVGRKVNAFRADVLDHLDRQDLRASRTAERTRRIEQHLGLDPLPVYRNPDEAE